MILIRRRLDDPLREGALSVVTPFAAFLLAEAVHASGVVAVVVAGLLLTYAGPRVIRARSRTMAFAFWELFTFLLNGGLFVLVGMQVPQIVRDLDTTTTARALVLAQAVTGTVIAARLAWVQRRHLRRAGGGPPPAATRAAGGLAHAHRGGMGRLPRCGVAGRGARRAGVARRR